MGEHLKSSNYGWEGSSKCRNSEWEGIRKVAIADERAFKKKQLWMRRHSQSSIYRWEDISKVAIIDEKAFKNVALIYESAFGK